MSALDDLQPYFREYCREKGYRTEADAKIFGGPEGFITWMGYKWIEWRDETGIHTCLCGEDHSAFGAWLPGKVTTEIKRITETPELNCHGDAV